MNEISNQPEDLAAWRNAERRRLVAAREAFPDETRRVADQAISTHLGDLLKYLSVEILGAYMPTRGEHDATDLLTLWRDASSRHTLSLPVVATPGEPLAFHTWRPDTQFLLDRYGIKYPSGSEVAQPDTLLVPLVGFDLDCYRLGYGGGYYDRTIATMPDTRLIGIGYELARLPTIYPQQHDMPLDYVITEAGCYPRKSL